MQEPTAFKTLNEYNRVSDQCRYCITWNCEHCPTKQKADSLQIQPGREEYDPWH